MIYTDKLIENKIFTINWLNSIIIYIFALYPLIGYVLRTRFDIWPAQLTMVVVVILFMLNKPMHLKVSQTMKYLGLFCLYVSIQLIIFGRSSAISDYKSFVTMFILYLILANFAISKRMLKNTRTMLFAIVILATFVIIYQFVVDRTFMFNYVDYRIEEVDLRRPASFFLWSGINSGGYSMPAFCSILISIYLSQNKRTIAILVYVAGALFALLSLTRYVMLSMLIVGSLFYIYSSNKKAFVANTFRMILYVVVFIFLILIISNFLGVNIEGILKNRVFEEGKDFDQTTASTRVLAFKLFNEVFWDKPIFGSKGRQTSELIDLRAGRTSQIHVGWLSLFYYFGVVGAFIYILFVKHLLRELKDTARKSNYWGSYIGFLTYFLSVLTTGVFFDLNVAGYVIAYAVHRHYKTYSTQHNHKANSLR